jgi:hypothetical protein
VTGRAAARAPGPLLALARASASGRRVSVAIREVSGPSVTGEVEVLALGWRWGGWVAAVRCVRRDAVRLLPVGRIAVVRPLRHRASSRPPGSFLPGEFASAELLDPEAGALRRTHLDLPLALAPLAAALFPGGRAEPRPGGVRVHLLSTNRPALRALAASLGLAVG